MFAEGIGDAECVRRVQQGDTDSFEILVRRHEKAVFNLIYRLLGNYDEALEIAQEVFLSAFKSIHKFRGEANFSTWLYRIGLNHASTRRKTLHTSQQRYVPLNGTEVIADGALDPVKNVEHKEIQQRVQQALNSLDRKMRASFCSGIFRMFRMRMLPRYLIFPLEPSNPGCTAHARR